MIGPEMPPAQGNPRSLLKRKQPALEVDDIVSEVCNYETISDYIQLYSPVPDQEDSNLSWLLNFKVSSLFDPAAEERPPPPRQPDTCQCAVVRTPGKPPFTYTELIEKALKEQGELTVSGIYSWISANYPYYSPNDDRWKNSVRHNLSINPHFRKGVKSRHGAGHLWTLSNEGVNPPPENWKRSRTVSRSPPATPCTPSLMDEAAVAAATLMQLDADPDEPDLADTDTLHQAAEQILSGVKRRVEVQYLVHDQNTNEFLNPVSKEEVVSESGLEEAGECATSSLLSELNADLHLPLNDNLFTDELAFTCYSHL